MKKKLVSVLLVSAMAATMLAGCGGNGGSSDSNSGTQAGDKTAAKGSVYLLNFKPETDEAWQNLAKTYTDQTGVDVTVLTAADGQYNTTLQAEMAKAEAPTIFTVGNSAAAKTWEDYTMDLSDTAIYDHLTDKSLTIKNGDKIVSVANCYECY